MPKSLFMKKLIKKTLFIIIWYSVWIFSYLNSEIIMNRYLSNYLAYIYEKLDKSNDKKIICLQCGHVSDMDKLKCYKCSNKLYKI